MILMISLLAVCLCGLIFWVVMKISELDDRQERLDKYSVHLDEMEEKFVAEKAWLSQAQKDFNEKYCAWLAIETYTASYTETDADTMKYTTDALMEAHARKHLAATIAGDIVKQFKVVEDRTEEGRRRFSYRFKIAEQ